MYYPSLKFIYPSALMSTLSTYYAVTNIMSTIWCSHSMAMFCRSWPIFFNGQISNDIIFKEVKYPLTLPHLATAMSLLLQFGEWSWYSAHRINDKFRTLKKLGSWLKQMCEILLAIINSMHQSTSFYYLEMDFLFSITFLAYIMTIQIPTIEHYNL